MRRRYGTDMQWSDEGIILGTRRLGENDVILEAMTRGHGRHLGLVRGGRSRRRQAELQPGNGVELVWRARLDAHLGHYLVEIVVPRAARLMQQRLALEGMQLLAAHLRLLPERDPHRRLHDAALVLLDGLHHGIIAGRLMVQFEMMLLDELGYGLDLSACAATGATEDLAYVSPRSGRAVSRRAGAPWKHKLLPLPSFLVAPEPATPDPREIVEGFRLTGFFLDRHVYQPRRIRAPDSRDIFLAQLQSS